jgi:hypothetical protein
MLDDVKKELIELKNTIAVLTEKISAPPMERTHVKTKEACTFFSCSKNTLNKICAYYGVCPQKIMGEYYYSVADLKKVFAQSC